MSNQFLAVVAANARYVYMLRNYMFRFEIFCIDGEGGSDGLVEFPGGSLSL